MSHSGDLESEIDESFNFWEPKQYLKTVKRLENSHKLCQELSNLVIERADIEKLYSTSLKKWSNKLIISLENNGEFGTSKFGWSSFSKEADEISEIHMDIRNKLIDNIQVDIKRWQKEHFHKATLPTPHFKEVKSLETEFENTQKPWCKRLKKSNICKKEYHSCCKLEKTLNIQFQNSRNDSTMTADQLKKIDERYKKAEKDMEKNKISYQASVQDLEGDSGRYMEEMDKIFKKTQVMEQERMEYFKDIFEKIRCILDTTKQPQLNDTYNNFKIGINEMNCDADLKNWSNNFGSTMLFQIPQFEEYTPEASAMTNKKKTVVNNQGGVTLMSVTSTGDSSPTNKSYESLNDIKKLPQKSEINYDESLNPFNSSDEPINNQNNKYDYEYNSIHNDHNNSLIQDTTPVVMVRALFDYNSTEEDELNLIVGDIFERLEPEDEQGWCKGRKNGSVGLYPANYAEPV